MPIDVASHLGAVRRTVRALERDGQPARAVILERSYDTDIDDLWDAMTNPGRLPRWFLPVEGDLKRGGRYQLKGNAGGTITDCEPPVHLGLTWEMMGQVSWVEVRLAREAEGRTRFTLTHTAPLSDFWRQYGPGAVGVGWEGGLMGLALYLADPAGMKLDEATFAASPEGKRFYAGSSERWGEAAIAAGEDADMIAAAVRATTAFYTGEPPVS
jgi:uncharacterized protein YndB with AHSA1/START domain|nr:MAG: polyketide cyclase [Pseudomonadota bacterium]